MGFGNVLKRNVHLLRNATENKCSDSAFWIILRDIAVQEIIAISPAKVDSDIAVEVYYNILCENISNIPEYYRVKLKSNNQERFRVINRNLWTSNAFHPEGLANQPGIRTHKEIPQYNYFI